MLFQESVNRVANQTGSMSGTRNRFRLNCGLRFALVAFALTLGATQTLGQCGDGLIVGAEACDDGNVVDADGCSSTCTVETGWICTGEPSVCTAVGTGADVTWDGGGIDNNWDTAENWSNDVVPTFFENVFFTSASSKDCLVTQNQVVFDFTMTAGYTGILSSSGNPSLTIANDMSLEGGSINLLLIIVEGNLVVSGGSMRTSNANGSFAVFGDTTITGGTVNWRNTEFTGDVLISGGTVTWSPGFHTFFGDYTRTGGTVTAPFTSFTFSANGPQVFTVGAGGIVLRRLIVNGGASQVLDIIGDITGTEFDFRFSSSSTTNLDGTLTLNSSPFQVAGSLTTFNVLNGSVVDATAAGSYINEGMINEIGTGKVLRTASVGFTDSAGAPVGSVPAGSDIFITLFDDDENIDGTLIDLVEVTVKSLVTDDALTLTLEETDLQSGEFRNAIGLTTEVGVASSGDNTLQQDGNEDLLVTYVDTEDASDTPSANLLAPPIVWDGGGADNNWNTPENWVGDVVPSFSEDVLFDATSTDNCEVTQFQEMLNLTIAAGYTGTISQSGGPTLQINGDLLVENGRINFSSSGKVIVLGNSAITGGTAEWKNSEFFGDLEISGGSVNWGDGAHQFFGDYIRTGGTVSTRIGTVFNFSADGPQAFTVGAGGITTTRLRVNGGPSQVLDINGDLAITQSIVFQNSSTTNLDGRLTLSPSTNFSISGFLTTLNVLDGSVVDAVAAGSYSNRGIINEIGTGVILRNATGVVFTDSLGAPVASAPVGTDVFITLIDEDESLDRTVVDTAEVTVTSLTTGDVETLVLMEINVQSTWFRNTVGLPTASGAAIPNDGILQQDGSEDLLVTYTDDEDPGDTISNNLLADPIVWDGGGTDNNWDTPENWDTDRVPTLFDSVIFDATSSKDCLVTLNQTMIDFTMAAGYAGTLSSSGIPLLQVNGDMSIAGGTINWSSTKRIDVRRNLAVSGGSLTMTASNTNIQVTRDTTITGGTVDWHRTTFTGNVFISGGSVTWGSGNDHTFRGDYIRTGGTVNTAAFTRFVFGGNDPQAFTIGAGGIALRTLRVHNPSSRGALVLNITGDITINAIGTSGLVSFSKSTTNLDGKLTLSSGNGFTVSDFGSPRTLNVLDGSVVDATAAGSYVNEGFINEIGTGKVLRFTTGVGLTESTGMIPVNKIDLGDPIFLLLFDEDENIDGNALDSAQITLTNLINGDFETVTLTERSIQSDEFFFAAGFPTAVGTAIIGNGILEASVGNIIQICYQDDEDPADRLCVFKVATVPDCNSNGVDDLVDIATGTSQDCDNNGIPDECKLPPIGDAPDCNNDLIPDICQLLNNDCNNNGTPDDCESFPDCNLNGVADSCDIFDGISVDCNLNGIPDECDSPDCDGDDIPDECEPDCDEDGIPDDCELDCNGNNIPEDCETFIDCNANGIPDECDLADGTSVDCNSNGIPDGCDLDVSDPDGNAEVSADININGIPDECEPQVCGNGLIQVAEGCDDGNIVDGDGCSSICAVESGHVCSGSPSVCQPTNNAPIGDAGGPYVGQAGNGSASFPCSASGSIDSDGDLLSYFWETNCPGGVFDDPTLENPTLTIDTSLTCDITCTVTVTADDGQASDSSTATVTVVDSTPPSIVCPNDVSVVNDLGTCRAVVTYSAPEGTDNCVNPITTKTAGLGSGGVFPVGTTTESYSVADGAGSTVACSFTVTVHDTELPSIVCPSNAIRECPSDTSVLANGSANGGDNCGSPILTSSDDVLDGCGITSLTTRTWTSTDDAGNSVSCDQLIDVVDTAAPDILSLDGSPLLTPIGSVVNFTTTFSDVCGAPMYAEWDFGDLSPIVVIDPAISPTTVGHSYNAAGIYTVTIAIFDDCGNSSSSSIVVVAYDPAAGFTTGGGWFVPDAESFVDGLNVTDTVSRANFGFVVKYKKGADNPDGNLEFVYKAGDINLHSTDMEWLVVQSATKVRFKGKATVNGEGPFTFKVTADDNGEPGTGDVFKIEIWLGVVDTESGPPTPKHMAKGFLGGGNIKIHQN